MNKTLMWMLAVVVAFLIGFLPGYFQARSADSRAEACEASVSLWQLRNQIGGVYVETNRKNYGTARELASTFFNDVRQEMDRTTDPALRQALQEVLAQRDQVITGLARGDAAILDVIQEIYMRIQDATRRALS